MHAGIDGGLDLGVATGGCHYCYQGGCSPRDKNNYGLPVDWRLNWSWVQGFAGVVAEARAGDDCVVLECAGAADRPPVA